MGLQFPWNHHHDRPVKPGAELRHWVQHVVNTRGAPHLCSPALAVPLYQRLYLDLVTFLSLVILVLFTLIKKIYHRVRSKKIVDMISIKCYYGKRANESPMVSDQRSPWTPATPEESQTMKKCLELAKRDRKTGPSVNEQTKQERET
uniref:SFRICE_023686 n=1 Tax=Spodoptera frugiperda TaxID=7108 RepID=A0A2H1WN73_SPOFR